MHDPVGCEEGQNPRCVADLKCCQILIDQVHYDTLLKDAVVVVALAATVLQISAITRHEMGTTAKS